MTNSLLIGIIILGVALVILFGLVLWSRRIIERIAREGRGLVREFVREKRNGR